MFGVRHNTTKKCRRLCLLYCPGVIPSSRHVLDKAIEMPFEGLIRVGLTNHVLDRGQHPLRERGNFGGCPAHWKALGVSVVGPGHSGLPDIFPQWSPDIFPQWRNTVGHSPAISVITSSWYTPLMSTNIIIIIFVHARLCLHEPTIWAYIQRKIHQT